MTNDKMRQEFERAYNAAYDFSNYLFNDTCYTNHFGNYVGNVNRDWIAFQKGFEAAWNSKGDNQPSGGEDLVNKLAHEIFYNSSIDLIEAKEIAKAALNNQPDKE